MLVTYMNCYLLNGDFPHLLYRQTRIIVRKAMFFVLF